jgi:hypothetical protein
MKRVNRAVRKVNRAQDVFEENRWGWNYVCCATRNQEYWAGGFPQHFLCCRAQQESLKPRSPVRTHDDEIAPSSLGAIEDFIRGISFGNVKTYPRVRARFGFGKPAHGSQRCVAVSGAKDLANLDHGLRFLARHQSPVVVVAGTGSHARRLQVRCPSRPTLRTVRFPTRFPRCFPSPS